MAEKKISLVIQEQILPGDHTKALWHCMALPPGQSPEVYKAMGYRVAEVEEKRAKQLLQAQELSTNLQHELRVLFYGNAS